MRHPGTASTRRLHPARGIGWIGLLGIPILLALAIGEFLAPHGLRYEGLRLLAESTHSTNGAAIRAASWLALTGLNLHVYTSWGVVALLYLLPAFWLAPREKRFLRLVIIPLWCVIESVMLYSPWSFLLADRIASSVGQPALTAVVPPAAAVVVHAILLWLATGSRRIPLTLVALFTVALVWEELAPWSGFGPFASLPVVITFRAIELPGAGVFAVSWSCIILHGVMAWLLLRWGLRERARAMNPHACISCGYSLENLSAPRCPECGADRSAPSPVHERSA